MLKRIIVYACLILVLLPAIALLRSAGVDESPVLRWLLMAIGSMLAVVFLFMDQWGFICLVLAFMPFTEGIFKFEVGVVTFSPYSMGLVMLTACTILQLALGMRRYKADGFDACLACLCAFYLTSTVLSSDIMDSGLLAFQTIFLPVVLYFNLKAQLDTEEKTELAFRFLIFGVFLFSLATIAQYSLEHQRLTMFNVAPISAATLTLVPILGLLFSGRKRSLPGMVSLLVCSAAYVLSFSRVYLASLLATPVLWRIIRGRRAMALFTCMFVASLVFTLVASFSIPKKDVDDVLAMGKSFNMEKEFRVSEKGAGRLVDPRHWMVSYEMRILTYRLGLENFLNSPTFGVGLHKGDVMVTQHNFHVEWLEFGGLLGYIFYSLVFFWYFATFSEQAQRDKETAVYVLSVFIILANCLTNGLMHGFFSHVVYAAMGFSFARRNVLSGSDGAVRTEEPSRSHLDSWARA